MLTWAKGKNWVKFTCTFTSKQQWDMLCFTTIFLKPSQYQVVLHLTKPYWSEEIYESGNTPLRFSRELSAWGMLTPLNEFENNTLIFTMGPTVLAWPQMTPIFPGIYPHIFCAVYFKSSVRLWYCTHSKFIYNTHSYFSTFPWNSYSAGPPRRYSRPGCMDPNEVLDFILFNHPLIKNSFHSTISSNICCMR